MERKRALRIDKGTHRPLKEKKVCPSCKIEKPISEFYKRFGGLVARSLCIECEKIEQKKYAISNYENEKRRRRIKLQAWNEWFKKTYGEHPKCQCCGVEMVWKSGNRRGTLNAVVFDHRNGGNEPIKHLTAWLTGRDVNERNKGIILDCDFGVICKRCNICLPTKDRTEWLNKAIKYVRKSDERRVKKVNQKT
jgi:hypothetical protein